MNSDLLKSLVLEANGLAYRMVWAITSVLNKYNGLLKTDTFDAEIPNLLGYIRDLAGEEHEHLILALKVEGNNLFILPDYASQETGTLEDWPPEEVWQAPEWINVMDDSVMSLATLYEICKYLECYL